MGTIETGVHNYNQEGKCRFRIPSILALFLAPLSIIWCNRAALTPLIGTVIVVISTGIVSAVVWIGIEIVVV